MQTCLATVFTDLARFLADWYKRLRPHPYPPNPDQPSRPPDETMEPFQHPAQVPSRLTGIPKRKPRSLFRLLNLIKLWPASPLTSSVIRTDTFH